MTVFVPASIVLPVTWVFPDSISVLLESEWMVRFALRVVLASTVKSEVLKYTFAPEWETFADVAKFEEIVVSVPANIVLLVTWVLPEFITVLVESEWTIRFAFTVVLASTVKSVPLT